MAKWMAFLFALLVATSFAVRAAEEEHPALQKVRALAKQEAGRDAGAAAMLRVLDGAQDTDTGTKGAGWLVRKARSGMVEAQFTLGTLLEAATPPNHKKAFEYHEAAARKGYPPAMSRVATMHFHGLGVPKDPAKALEWAKRAGETGDPAAQAWLGARYYEGEIVPKDIIASRDWLEKSIAQKKEPLTIMLLIGVYQRTGVPGDEEKALALAKTLGESMKGTSAPKESQAPAGESPAERIERLMASAKADDTAAQAQLGLRYMYGEGVEKDFKQAHEWLSKAAAKGNPSAMANLGVLYATGNGVAKDETRAVELYRDAAAKGNATGQANLGYHYRRGTGGLARDDAEAARLFTLAAGQGNRVGQRMLAQMHEAGAGGVAKDRAKAIELYRKAAAQGDNQATERLKVLEK